MLKSSDRLSYLVYRCLTCRRPLTKLEIIARWEHAERTGEPCVGACSCGGSRISPTNLSLWEELSNPKVWVLWWKEVVLPRILGTRRPPQ